LTIGICWGGVLVTAGVPARHAEGHAPQSRDKMSDGGIDSSRVRIRI
jgi:hypothetical protein